MGVEELEKAMLWLFQETYSREETSRRLRRFVRQKRQGEGPIRLREKV